MTMTTKLSALVEIFQCVENVSKVEGGVYGVGRGCFDWVLLSASSHTKAWTVIHIIITCSRIGKRVRGGGGEALLMHPSESLKWQTSEEWASEWIEKELLVNAAQGLC